MLEAGSKPESRPQEHYLLVEGGRLQKSLMGQNSGIGWSKEVLGFLCQWKWFRYPHTPQQ